METINLYKVLLALSSAIDLAEDSMNYENTNDAKHRYQNHSRRTGYVAVSIAKQLKKRNSFLEKVYVASIIHDIGITEDVTSSHWDDEFISQHSIKGYELAKRLPIHEDIPEIIRYHHENFDGSGSFDLKGEDIPLISQIIRLADTFEIYYDEARPNYVQRKGIIERIHKNANVIFSPELVDIFMKIQSKDFFWWDIENIGSIPAIMNKIKPNLIKRVSMEDIKNIALVFSDIIDSRSPFTYKHSVNLTNMITEIGKKIGMEHNKLIRFEIAALLHDIGKLAVPSSILNKDGPLTDIERAIMNSHTYYTRIILSQIDGFEDITDWASNHHEKLNGIGYPIGLEGKDLGVEERIIAVCDIYDALISDRPYKKGLSKEKSLSIISDMVKRNELCGEALKLLEEIVQ